MKADDLIGRRVGRVLQKVFPNGITFYKQEGRVTRKVRGNNKKVWVLFDDNINETSVEVSRLKVID